MGTRHLQQSVLGPSGKVGPGKRASLGVPLLGKCAWDQRNLIRAQSTRSLGAYGLDLDTLALQIAQNRPYLCTLGPKVGIIYIHGAPGLPTAPPKSTKMPAPDSACYNLLGDFEEPPCRSTVWIAPKGSGYENYGSHARLYVCACVHMYMYTYTPVYI